MAATLVSAVLVATATPSSTSAVLAARSAAASAAPSRLAVYYGYPSLINGAAGQLDRSVATFGAYDVVVLGDGLEFASKAQGPGPGTAEHDFTIRLIERLHASPKQTRVYGYVDLGRSQQLSKVELTKRIGLWADMKADGIFFDEAGFDFGVRRERQNDAVSATHARGLSAFLNAFQPSDVFESAVVPLNSAGGGNPSGIAPVIGRQDAVLLESFAVRLGVPVPAADLLSRTRAALAGRRQRGTKVYGIATGADTTDGATASPYGWWSAALLGIDGYGWSPANYGAINSRLDVIAPPTAEALLQSAEFSGDAEVTASVWRRSTTRGTITLDTVTRRGTFIPR